jgi:hypothetical protein
VEFAVALAQQRDAVLRFCVVGESLADPPREPLLRSSLVEHGGAPVAGERHVEWAAVQVHVAKFLTLEHDRG